MKSQPATKSDPTPDFSMLEELFKQKVKEEKKPKPIKFSLAIRKKGKHEL